MKIIFCIHLFIILIILGCSQSHFIEKNEQSYKKINEKIKGKYSLIRFRNEKKERVKIVAIKYDSVYWVHPKSKTRNVVPTSDIGIIIIPNRLRGAFCGLGMGILIGGILGNLKGRGEEKEGSEDPGLQTLAGTNDGGFIGGFFGFMVGFAFLSKDKYIFMAPSDTSKKIIDRKNIYDSQYVDLKKTAKNAL